MASRWCVPLIKRAETPEHDLFAETDYPLRFGWAPLRALRSENGKLIEAPRPELYDLKADPGELKNLYSTDSSQAKGMQAELEKWKSKASAGTDSAKPGTALPDPKDKIEVQNLLHRSMLASDDNRSSDARGFLEKALELDPASPTALRQLGELELAAGDYSKAAAHLKRAREVRPPGLAPLGRLGGGAVVMGNDLREHGRDAVHALGRAVRRAPPTGRGRRLGSPRRAG